MGAYPHTCLLCIAPLLVGGSSRSAAEAAQGAHGHGHGAPALCGIGSLRGLCQLPPVDAIAAAAAAAAAAAHAAAAAAAAAAALAAAKGSIILHYPVNRL